LIIHVQSIELLHHLITLAALAEVVVSVVVVLVASVEVAAEVVTLAVVLVDVDKVIN
jgi:hypothetical protein